MDIGKKLKELRLQNDLTLGDLASRSELTKGFLSQVERNLTTPSIATLEDILEALGTDLSQFFQPEKQQKIVFHTSDFFEDDQEDFKIEWIVPNAQKNDMEPILLTLHPGAKSMEMVSHSGEEFGYVLEGRVVLVNGEKEYTVKKGETFYLNGKNFHYIKNERKTKAVVLWVSTPPLF